MKHQHQIPDYQQQNQTKHRKQRSSTTIALDQLNDDFSSIAKNVQAYGSKQPMVSGPTHYRKFSNTTKMIMDQHKNGNDDANGWQQSTSKGHRARDSMKIADIVDEHGIDYDSEEEEEMQQQRLERQSNDEKDEETKERPVKTRNARESIQLDDNQVHSFVVGDDDEETKEEDEP